MNTELYVGGIAKYLNGTDIAWILGLIAASVLYYFPAKKKAAKFKNSLSSIQNAPVEQS